MSDKDIEKCKRMIELLSQLSLSVVRKLIEIIDNDEIILDSHVYISELVLKYNTGVSQDQYLALADIRELFEYMYSMITHANYLVRVKGTSDCLTKHLEDFIASGMEEFITNLKTKPSDEVIEARVTDIVQKIQLICTNDTLNKLVNYISIMRETPSIYSSSDIFPKLVSLSATEPDFAFHHELKITTVENGKLYEKFITLDDADFEHLLENMKKYKKNMMSMKSSQRFQALNLIRVI